MLNWMKESYNNIYIFKTTLLSVRKDDKITHSLFTLSNKSFRPINQTNSFHFYYQCTKLIIVQTQLTDILCEISVKTKQKTFRPTSIILDINTIILSEAVRHIYHQQPCLTICVCMSAKII